MPAPHIKASANKKKFQKEQVAKTAKVYSGQLRREANAEREALGKKPIEDDEDDNDPQNPSGGGTTEKTVSTTDPDSGMFVTTDAGYKPPWIAKKTLDDGKVPVLPYTRYNGNQDRYKP